MKHCIFCKIVRGEIPAEKVYEDDLVISFKDINQEAPVHVLIIPKKHISSLNDITKEDRDLISHIYMVTQKLAKELKVDKRGYRIVCNCGKEGGQTVSHIHFHILGGRALNWPPG